MTTIGIVCSLIVTGYVIYIAKPMPGSGFFPWHPSLMSAAILGLLTFGISSISKKSKAPYDQKVLIHFACNMWAAILICGGFYAIYAYKENQGYHHYVTTHGQLGLVVASLLVVQSMASTPLLFQHAVAKVIGGKNLKLFKMIHRYFSTVTYIMAMAEIILGFYTKWFSSHVSELEWNIFAALTAITLVTVILQVR